MVIDPLCMTPYFTSMNYRGEVPWGQLMHGCPYCGKWNTVAISFDTFMDTAVCVHCKEGYELYNGYKTELNPSGYYSCKRGLTDIKKFYTWKPRKGKWIRNK